MKLGGYIRVQRMKKNLSMRELSRQSGVTLSYLSNIENDKMDHPNVEMVLDIFRVLDIPSGKLADFGLIEKDDISAEDKYNRAKMNRYKREIQLMLEGMEPEETESLFLLLKDHYHILELFAEIENMDQRNKMMEMFQVYVEFMMFQEQRKKGIPVEWDKNAEKEFEILSKFKHK